MSIRRSSALLTSLLLTACAGEAPSASDLQQPYSPEPLGEGAAGAAAVAVQSPALAIRALDTSATQAQEQRLAIGQGHGCRILGDGAVRCWGNNSDGQLGVGDRVTRGDGPYEMGESLPWVQLGTGRTAVSIAVGERHTCALLDDGSVKCWGDNSYGQLGLGHVNDIGDGANEMGDALPAVQLGSSKIVSIAVGLNHACALAEDASLKCWGQNSDGQLGLGDIANRGTSIGQMGANLPAVNIGNGRKAVAIAAGGRFSCALRDDNGVRCWGANDVGQLGQGNTLRRGDQPGEMGDALAPTEIANSGTHAVGISAGLNSACVLYGLGVVCWGDNAYGQLGQNDTVRRGDQPGEVSSQPYVALGAGRSALAITVGAEFACALLDDGTVKCWGRNTYGTLAQGDTMSRGDGPNEMGENLPRAQIGNFWGVTAIAASPGANSVCAQRSNGAIKCWGNNSGGQLGLGHTEPVASTPTYLNDQMMPLHLRRSLALGSHSCALIEGGVLRCWGKNDRGQLGLGHKNNIGDGPGEMSDALPAVDLGPVPPVAVGANILHTCALLRNGSVKCWGANTFGQLGLGHANDVGDGASEMGANLPAVNLGPGRTARAIAVGADHTCALLDDYTVKCWGRNDYGQLGQNDTATRGTTQASMANLAPIHLGTGRTARALAAGYSHTCALLDDTTIKCWGRSNWGQLGQGNTNSRGHAPNSMLNLAPVSLGAGTPIAIGARSDHTCAQFADGALKCWGKNNYGQLGLGDVSHRGDNLGEMGTNLPVVPLGPGRRVRMLSVGSDFTCALADNTTLKCWGRNDFGQLGQSHTSPIGDQPGELADNVLPSIAVGDLQLSLSFAAGISHACSVNETGSIYCWGRNFHGELGLGDVNHRGDASPEMGSFLPRVQIGANRRVETVSSSLGNHTCAILDDGTLKCWGGNQNCQLGLGEPASVARGDQPGEMGNALPAVNLGWRRAPRALALGVNHTCALLDNGTIKCWGNNFGSYKLGRRDKTSVGCSAADMGDALPVVDLGVGKTAVAVTAGYDHTCALLNDGYVKCWGVGMYGELGGPASGGIHGDQAGEMGNALPVIDFGGTRRARAISGGLWHTCAIIDHDNTVRCWGRNGVGQLGVGNTADLGDTAGEVAASFGASTGTGFPSEPVRLLASGNSSCALLKNGTAKCWGENAGSAAGALGLGDQNHRGDAAGEMSDALPAIALGTGWTPGSFMMARGHACAVRRGGGAGNLKCWGTNAFGKLGLGDTATRGDQAGEMGDSLPSVALGTGAVARSVVGFTDNTCALLTDGTVKCWGESEYLGLGSSGNPRGDQAGEMGDSLPAVRLGD